MTRRWPCGPTVYHAPRWPIRGPGACAILAGISGDWPYLLGYNETRAKPDAEVLLRTGVAPESHPERGDLRLQSVGPARGYCSTGRSYQASLGCGRAGWFGGIGDVGSFYPHVRACMASYATSIPPSSLMREATALISTLSCINPSRIAAYLPARLQSFVVVAWGRGATKPYFVDDSAMVRARVPSRVSACSVPRRL